MKCMFKLLIGFIISTVYYNLCYCNIGIDTALICIYGLYVSTDVDI